MREVEFQAAVKIQSWFRATKIRSYLRHLYRSARKIQAQWRGYLGRTIYREILREKVTQMKLDHYNNLATKVQKVWRGYYTRKYIFNYYSRKTYLDGLKVKNEIIRRELADYQEQQEQKAELKAESAAQKKLQEYAQKHHYLVSTEVMPGIYNSPFQPYPDEIEFHLRNTKPQLHTSPKEGVKYDPTWKGYDLPQLQPLPPISKKPQGPFRDPHKVQKQRYKQWHPSLRVATSYTSVEEAREKMKQEEWMTRLNDNIFLPFTKKSASYDPLLHTTSKFGHMPYGTKFFRHEYVDKFVVPQNFQMVVPPIPIFEKLNNTYSQGQV